MLKRIIILIFCIIIFLDTSCHKFWGSYPLGNNLWSMGGDTKEDRIIVYCSHKEWGGCFAGIPVIPTYQRQFDSSGHYAEYVVSSNSNKRWVIVKTFYIVGRLFNYWLISKDFNIKGLDCAKRNCDSILQSHVIGPLNSTEFENKKKVLKIDLDFK